MTSNDAANEKEWQSGIGTIQERMKHLLENGLNSDVQFLLVTGEELPDGKEEKELIKAHKFILEASSSIFAAQFRFNKSSGQDDESPIEIKDISASAFNAMLNYLYTNDISSIDAENIGDVYFAAKKYLLNILAQKCIGMIIKMLDKKNVFGVLRVAKLYEETVLIEHCWKFIDEGIDRFQSEEFYALNQEEMGEILGRDSLRIQNEWSLFVHLDKWAKKQCKNAGILEPTGKQKRAKMGPILYAIRFPLIPPMDFIKLIVSSGILNKEEIASMLLYYSENVDNDHQLPFSKQPRAIPPRAHNKLMDKFVTEEEKNKLINENIRLRIENRQLQMKFAAEKAMLNLEIGGKNAEIKKKNKEIRNKLNKMRKMEENIAELQTENEQLQNELTTAYPYYPGNGFLPLAPSSSATANQYLTEENW